VDFALIHRPASQPETFRRDFIFLKIACKSVLSALGCFGGIFIISNGFGDRISTF